VNAAARQTSSIMSTQAIVVQVIHSDVMNSGIFVDSNFIRHTEKAFQISLHIADVEEKFVSFFFLFFFFSFIFLFRFSLLNTCVNYMTCILFCDFSGFN